MYVGIQVLAWGRVKPVFTTVYMISLHPNHCDMFYYVQISRTPKMIDTYVKIHLLLLSFKYLHLYSIQYYFTILYSIFVPTVL